jgi:hypothetical protein
MNACQSKGPNPISGLGGAAFLIHGRRESQEVGYGAVLAVGRGVGGGRAALSEEPAGRPTRR